MLDKIGHIKNPLTVIAMFAAIAEVSGAIVLPFIAPENQATYIWFLMSFPVLLVLVFFATLNFNHKALYAPSDWKDESNFFRKFSSATTLEVERKITDDLTAAEMAAGSTADAAPTIAQPEVPNEMPRATASENPKPARSDTEKLVRDRMLRFSAAESAAIRKLSTDLGIQFQQNIVFHPTKNRRVIFDAIAMERGKITAAEVKLIFNDHPSRSNADRLLLEAEKVARSVRESGSEFVLHYVAVLDSMNIDRAVVESRLRQYLNEFDLNIKLHVFNMDELGLSSFDETKG